MNPALSKDPPVVDMNEFQSWILHEDDDVLVLDKPGWLVCHPSKNGPLSSLVGASKSYLNTETLHLASRLDRETSGVVLLAKHRKSASHWQKGIEQKTVRRNYIAILNGNLTQEKVVSNYLGKDPYSPVYVKHRVTDKSRKAKLAETLFSPLICKNNYTLCSVSTLTGRKHQIRIHAQWIKCPLVGEKLYGKDESIYLDFCSTGWKEEWADVLGMYRQALHGRSLIDTLSKNEFVADLPNDFWGFLISVMKVKKQDVSDALLHSDKGFRASLWEN